MSAPFSSRNYVAELLFHGCLLEAYLVWSKEIYNSHKNRVHCEWTIHNTCVCTRIYLYLDFMCIQPLQSAVLFVMFIEALTVLIRQDSHFRVTRALRPILFIDSHYLYGVRRSVLFQLYYNRWVEFAAWQFWLQSAEADIPLHQTNHRCSPFDPLFCCLLFTSW